MLLVQADVEVALGRGPRRVDDHALALRGTLEPSRIWSGLPTVADRPTRWMSFLLDGASRSITDIRCAPRSVPASACTSSITMSRRSSKSRSTGERGETSITSSDSGVVIRISAGSSTNLRLARSATSPCQTKRRSPTISA